MDNNNTHSRAKLKSHTRNMKPNPNQTPQQQQECHLDELGYCFVRKCIQIIEARGLDDQGLYRIGGVNSRVARLLQMCLDRKNFNPTTGQVKMPDFSDPVEWETKTITSALKNYLRNLSEPLMTYDLHPSIIEAAKLEDRETRTGRIKNLIQQLPNGNFTLLKTLVEHLRNVASRSDKNLMTVSNLGICFAPTLMRGPDEGVLSIMEIKYSNVVANTLIEEYDSIFNDYRISSPQSYQDAKTHQIPYATQVHHQLECPEEQFALGLPTINKHHNNHQAMPVSSNLIGHQINNQIIEEYDTIFNDPRMNLPHPYQDIAASRLPYTPQMNQMESHEEQFALGLPVMKQQNHQQSYSVNSNLIGHQLNNRIKCQNCSNDLAQFALKVPYYPTQHNHTGFGSDKVITLYACVADTESELSFGPNEYIVDVRPSAERGWLIGTLERNGHRGLLPENYVKFI